MSVFRYTIGGPGRKVQLVLIIDLHCDLVPWVQWVRKVGAPRIRTKRAVSGPRETAESLERREARRDDFARTPDWLHTSESTCKSLPPLEPDPAEPGCIKTTMIV